MRSNETAKDDEAADEGALPERADAEKPEAVADDLDQGGAPISAPPCYWMRPSRGRGRSTACRASRRKWNLQIGDQQAAIAKEGRVEALVGQRPFEMGYKAPSVMIDLIEGKKVDDPVFTGLDECTKDTADTCIQK